jgi:hypothetical protein
MRAIGTAVTIGFVGLAVVAWSEARAQPQQPGVGVTAPAPTPAPPAGEPWLEPTAPLEQQGTREQEFYPGPVRSRHDPAFVRPFTVSVPRSETSRARVGLSGWTAPALPFDIPQSSGGVAFGFTIQWDVPVGETETRPAPENSQR